MPDQWDPTSRDFIEGREEMTVNNYAQYCSVVKTGIGKAKMTIGGEVDAGKLVNRIAVEHCSIPLSVGLQTKQQR